MNKLLRSFLLLTAMVGVSHAQVSTRLPEGQVRVGAAGQNKARVAVKPTVESEAYAPFVDQSFRGAAMPLAHDLQNATYTGVSGTYDRQTNGGALHNFQIDPSNPNRIHAAIMTTTNPVFSETTDAAYPSRRVMYVSSTDGGQTWSAPVALGNVRGGYPSMVMVRRGTSYFPVIAMHQIEPDGTALLNALYVQKDDGTFSVSYTTPVGTNELEYIWPQIAVSPNQQTLYMVASYTYPTPAEDAFPAYQPLRIGTFDLNADGTSEFNGWQDPILPDFPNRTWGYAGVYSLRVSDAGKLGLFYVNHNYEEGDMGLYFLESTDEGATWTSGGEDPANPMPMFPSPSATTESGMRMQVADHLDFFYQGEVPHFTMAVNLKIGPYTLDDNGDDSSGFYFPTTTELYYYNPNATALKLINHESANAMFTFANGYPLYNSTDNPIGIDVYDSAAYITYPSSADFPDVFIPEYSFINHPVFIRTSNPQNFGIVYETIKNDAFGELPEWSEDSRVDHWFNSLYYQFTTNGGEDWSAPKEFRSALETDLRHPMASDFNNITKVEDAKILFAADSLPGQFRGPGRAGWGVTYWYMQNGATLSVKRTGTTDNLSLEQNFPNPFNPTTSVAFSVKEAAQVRLVVEDMMGREVAVAFEGMATPGQTHNVKIDASKLASGVYQYVLKTENESVARRMVLSK